MCVHVLVKGSGISREREAGCLKQRHWRRWPDERWTDKWRERDRERDRLRGLEEQRCCSVAPQHDILPTHTRAQTAFAKWPELKGAEVNQQGIKSSSCTKWGRLGLNTSGATREEEREAPPRRLEFWLSTSDLGSDTIPGCDVDIPYKSEDSRSELHDLDDGWEPLEPGSGTDTRGNSKCCSLCFLVLVQRPNLWMNDQKAQQIFLV